MFAHVVGKVSTFTILQYINFINKKLIGRVKYVLVFSSNGSVINVMRNNDDPILVCLTSTRNYGWCIKAFLEVNSRWADYIIIVDQMSTDNTREICAEYDKVIIVDNTDLTYSETIRCKLAIEKAREIKGDKIFIYLAIDEVLSANAKRTCDWKRILNSSQKEVGLLKWANVCSNGITYNPANKSDGSPFWMARIFHDDGVTPYNNEGLDMHTHCIPYPQNAKEFFINDFIILHLERYNTHWSLDKNIFYQFVDYNKNRRSAIKLDRMYNYNRSDLAEELICSDWLNYGFDVFSLLDLSRSYFFYEQIYEFIKCNRIKCYVKLNVWTDELLEYLGILDPRPNYIKCIHLYLNYTRNIKNFIIKMIDKCLSYII